MIIDYWYFSNREDARNIEKEVLILLRNKFPQKYLSKEDMPQSGYTEAFAAGSISSKKVIKMINKIIEEYDLKVRR